VNQAQPGMISGKNMMVNKNLH